MRSSNTRSLVVILGLIVSLFLGGASLAAADSKLSEHFFDSDGTKIHYLAAGEGEPVILIHGFTANAWNNWMETGVFGKLAGNFRVIAIDARGHGKSDKPHDPAVYGTNMAQDVLNLMDHLEIKKAHVGGYSMGGFVTMKLISMAPSRFESAIVAGAGWRQEGADRTFFDELGASLEAGKGLTPLLRALSPEGAEPPNEEALEMMNQIAMAQNDPLALAAAIRGMGDLTVAEEWLRKNPVPTLAIIGGLDPLKEGVDAMTPVMKNLEVVIIDGGDHITTLLNPQFASQLADGMHGFLARVCECL